VIEMYPYRKRFDAKAKAVIQVLVDAGYTNEVPIDMIWQAIRRVLGMTKTDAIRSFVETLHACGYIAPGENPVMWALHLDEVGIQAEEEGS